jgi:hypothetical protein
MLEELKPVETLTVADLLINPVWQFANHDDLDEALVCPFKMLPAHDLAGKVIGTQVRLANGASVWAVLGNIDAGSPRKTEHLLSVSFDSSGMENGSFFPGTTIPIMQIMVPKPCRVFWG